MIGVVGAAIGRPAPKCYVFALAFGEFVICDSTDEQCSPLQHRMNSMGSLFYAFFRYLINAEVVEIMHTRSVKKAVEPTMAV